MLRNRKQYSLAVLKKNGEKLGKLFLCSTHIPVKAGWWLWWVLGSSVAAAAAGGPLLTEGAGWRGGHLPPRDAPISLLSLLGSPQKFSFEEKIP